MLSHDQFSALSTLLKDETAVVLEMGKEYLVESRLTCLAREEGFTSLSDLVDTVLQRTNPALNQKALLALTTNETSFFRDVGAFNFLKKTVIPHLMKSRAGVRTLTLWSAACSTGQEPYSIAMSLKEDFEELDDWKVKILASDLNPRVVSKASEGVYTSLEVQRGLPVNFLDKYLTQDGDFYQLHEDLKYRVSFFEQNLISSWPPVQVDVLFMRNVLIYFDTETKRAIFEKIKSVLAPDGYLFLGTAETPYRIVEGFVKVGGIVNVYQQEATEAQQKERSKLKV